MPTGPVPPTQPTQPPKPAQPAGRPSLTGLKPDTALPPIQPGQPTVAQSLPQLPNRLPPQAQQAYWSLFDTTAKDYWVDPGRLSRYYSAIMSVTDPSKLPNWLDTTAIKSAYTWLQYKNPGKPWYEWQMPGADDPAVQLLSKLAPPPADKLLPYEASQFQLGAPQPDYGLGPQVLDFTKMPKWEQAYLSLMVPQDIPTISNRPQSSKNLALFGSASGAALMGGLIGFAIGNVPGAIIGALALGGSAMYQTGTGNKIPLLSDALYLAGMPAEGLERALGLVKQSNYEGVDAVVKDLGDYWKAGTVTYESQNNATMMNLFASAVSFLAGEEAEQAGPGQVWKISEGYIHPQYLDYQGQQAFRDARAMAEQGAGQEEILAEVASRFGDSGSFNNFVDQLVLDPLNLVGYASSKGGQLAAKLAGKPELAKAFKVAAGDPFVDMLPPGFQQVFEGISGIRGSQGAVSALKQYRGVVRAVGLAGDVEGTFKPVGQLDWFDRMLGGLTKEGQIRELLPQTKKGPLAQLRSLAPDAKAAMFLDNLMTGTGQLTFAVDDPKLPNAERAGALKSMLEKYAEPSTVSVGDAGEALLRSPLTATTSAAVKDFVKSNGFQELFANWMNKNTQDVVSRLNGLATKLGESPSDLVDHIKNTPDDVATRIQALKGVDPTITELGDVTKLKNAFALFTGKRADGIEIEPQAWMFEDFRARVLNAMNTQATDFLVKRFGIKEASAITRIAGVLKAVQSAALLDVNPGYFVNNFLNNMITRAVDGIGGFLTKGQIDEWWTRFGPRPARLAEGFGMQAEAPLTPGSQYSKLVLEMTNVERGTGSTAKLARTINQARSKFGVFSALSGKVEGTESAQAYTIATQEAWRRLWQPGTGYSKMPAVLEQGLRGIDPKLPEKVYRIINSGLSGPEIEEMLWNNPHRADIANILSESINEIAPHTQDITLQMMERLFPGDAISKELETARTPADVDAAFQRIRDRIEESINARTTTEDEGVRTEVGNRIQVEGAATLPDLFVDSQERIWSRWMEHYRVTSDAAQNIMELPKEQRADAWKAVNKNESEQWDRVFNRELQTYVGVADQLGGGGPKAQEILKLMRSNIEALQRFFNGYDIDSVTGEPVVRRAAPPAQEFAGVRATAPEDFATMIGHTVEQTDTLFGGHAWADPLIMKALQDPMHAPKPTKRWYKDFTGNEWKKTPEYPTLQAEFDSMVTNYHDTLIEAGVDVIFKKTQPLTPGDVNALMGPPTTHIEGKNELYEKFFKGELDPALQFEDIERMMNQRFDILMEVQLKDRLALDEALITSYPDAASQAAAREWRAKVNAVLNEMNTKRAEFRTMLADTQPGSGARHQAWNEFLNQTYLPLITKLKQAELEGAQLLPHGSSSLDLGTPVGAVQGLSAGEFRNGLITMGNLTPEQADRVMVVQDAFANYWARKTGRTPEEYYTSQLAGVQKGGERASLLQRDIQPNRVVTQEPFSVYELTDARDLTSLAATATSEYKQNFASMIYVLKGEGAGKLFFEPSGTDHESMLYALQGDAYENNIDNMIRFTWSDGQLGTSIYEAGVPWVDGQPFDEIAATNNIYKALAKLTANGLPEGTPVKIFRWGGTEDLPPIEIHTSKGLFQGLKPNELIKAADPSQALDEVWRITDATEIDKYPYFAVLVSGKGKGDVLGATGTSGLHEDLLAGAGYPRREIDNTVRFYEQGGMIHTSVYSAGVTSEGITPKLDPAERTRALNNIYNALDILIDRGLPDGTPIAVHEDAWDSDQVTPPTIIHAYNKKSLYQDWYYSPTARALSEMPQEKLTVASLRNQLKKAPGDLADEWQFNGMDEFFKSHKDNDIVTKAEVAQLLKDHQVTMETRTLGENVQSSARPQGAVDLEGLTDYARSIEQQYWSDRTPENLKLWLDARADLANTQLNDPEYRDLFRALLERRHATAYPDEAMPETQPLIPNVSPENERLYLADLIHTLSQTPYLAAGLSPLDLAGVRAYHAGAGESPWRLTELVREYLQDPRHDLSPIESEIMSLTRDATKAIPRTNTVYETYTQPGGTNYREVLFYTPVAQGFQSQHFDSLGKNLLMHMRMQDYINPSTGKKVLFLEEMQSDWLQAGAKEGFARPGELPTGWRAEQTNGWTVISGEGTLDSMQQFPSELDAMRQSVRDAGYSVLATATGTWNLVNQRSPWGSVFNRSLNKVLDIPTEEAALRKGMEILSLDTKAPGAGYILWSPENVNNGTLYPNLEVAAQDAQQMTGIVPNAPFSETWHKLGLKYLINYAAQNGYDSIQMTTGKQQYDRWGTPHLDWERVPAGETNEIVVSSVQGGPGPHGFRNLHEAYMATLDSVGWIVIHEKGIYRVEGADQRGWRIQTVGKPGQTWDEVVALALKRGGYSFDEVVVPHAEGFRVHGTAQMGGGYAEYDPHDAVISTKAELESFLQKAYMLGGQGVDLDKAWARMQKSPEKGVYEPRKLGNETFYDQKLPDELRKMTKRFGTTVEKAGLGGGTGRGFVLLGDDGTQLQVTNSLNREAAVELLMSDQGFEAFRMKDGTYEVRDKGDGQVVGVGDTAYEAWTDAVESADFAVLDRSKSFYRVTDDMTGITRYYEAPPEMSTADAFIEYLKDSGGYFQEQISGGRYEIRDINGEVLRTDIEPAQLRDAWLEIAQEDHLTVEPYQIKGEEVHTLKINDMMRKEAAKAQPLFQGAKGATDFDADGKATISFFEASDVSTALHEGSHVWLRTIATSGLKEDMDVITNWLRTTYKMELPDDWGANPDPTIYRDAHEKFARATERYFRQGKAPAGASAMVVAAFQSFKSWLKEIYARITGSEIDVKITPELRKLLDSWMSEAEPQLQGTSKAPVSLNQGDVMAEGYNSYVKPVLDSMQSKVKASLADQHKAVAGKIPANLSTSLRTYLNQVTKVDMPGTKAAALNYGEMQRDFALLNYHQRYGFDTALSTLFPYQFWFTRSMMNWALRMIDKPQWFAAYSKLQNLQQATERKGVPSRLRGKLKMLAPWLPEWAGGGIYTDPYKQIFPFLQLAQPFQNLQYQLSDKTYAAKDILQQMVKDGEVDPTTAAQAAQTQTGPVWETAWNRANQQSDADLSNPATMVGLMMQPAMYLTTPYYALTGQANKIGVLPGTRFGAGAEAVTKGTPLEIAGKGLGLIAKPEQWARKSLGLPELGEFTNNYVDRQLAAMAADGTASAQDVLTAMIERQGPLYEQAMERARYEQGMKSVGVPGIAAVAGVAQGRGTVLDATGGLLATMFPAGLWSEGEIRLQGLYDEYSNAWKKYEAGDTKAVQHFFDDHPEYEARIAQYKDPESRLRNFLIGQIWDSYWKLSGPNKGVIVDYLGEPFVRNILDKTTADPSSVDLNTLSYWAQTLGGKVPGTPLTQSALNVPIAQQKEAPKLYAGNVNEAVKQYWDDRDAAFPHISKIIDMYYTVEGGDPNVLKMYPQLNDYWAWNRKYLNEHPIVDAYHSYQVEQSTGKPYSYTERVYTPAPASVKEYWNLRDQMFPNISATQNAYYKVPQGDKSVLAAHPELRQYWDWNRQYKAEHPDVAAYIASGAKEWTSRTVTKPSVSFDDLSQFDPALIRQLYGLVYAGQPLSDGARDELYRLWLTAGRPNGTFPEYLKAIKDLVQQ